MRPNATHAAALVLRGSTAGILAAKAADLSPPPAGISAPTAQPPDPTVIRPSAAEGFVSPDSYFAANLKGRPSNGFEFGVFGGVTFGQLLGTSTKPF